jgi:hypothetical protein
MKYRLLTNEELRPLEKEFINFLAANTITASDWVNLKTNQPEKAFSMIETFSDMVLERALTNIKHIEHRSASELKLFHYQKDKITLVGIVVDEALGPDLTNPESLKQVTEKLESADRSLVKIYKTEKPYHKQREVELFEMLESGCLIVDDSLYNTLSKLA